MRKALALHWNRWLRVLTSMALGYCATQSLMRQLGAMEHLAQNPAWLIVYGGISCVLWRVLGAEVPAGSRVRLPLTVLVLSGTFGVCLVIGRALDETARLAPILYSRATLWAAFVEWLGWVALGYALLRPLMAACLRATDRPFVTRAPWLQKRIGFYVLWVAIAALWIPVASTIYPGHLSPDSHSQLQQVWGEAPLQDAHPLLHTGLIALCSAVGQLLGLARAQAHMPYLFLQYAALSAACAYAAWQLLRSGGRGWAWGCFAFFALYPIHPLLGFTLWKDVPHAAVTLTLVTELFLCAGTPEQPRSWRRLVWLGSLWFLFGTLRHNALPACLLVLPWFAWRYRAWGRRVPVMALSVFLAMGIYAFPAKSLLHVQEPPITESLSVPIQFAGRLVTLHRESLTADDLGTLAEVLPVDRIPALYDWRISDPVKYAADSQAMRDGLPRYAALTLSLARRFPGVFAESFLLGNLGYWYPQVQWMVWPFGLAAAEDAGEGLEQIGSFFAYRLSQWPGISLLCGIGFMVWIIAFAGGVSFLRHKRGAGLPFALLGLLWVSLLAMPVFAEYRYAYALILCAPVCLGFAVSARTTPKEAATPAVIK